MINNLKSVMFSKILLALIIFTSSILAQQLKVIDVKGDVKYQSGTSESWMTVKNGEVLQSNGFISTGKNSGCLCTHISLGSVVKDRFPSFSKEISDSLKPYLRSRKST